MSFKVDVRPKMMEIRRFRKKEREEERERRNANSKERCKIKRATRRWEWNGIARQGVAGIGVRLIGQIEGDEKWTHLVANSDAFPDSAEGRGGGRRRD
ncbi:hypothetical protein X798_08067 [Onchocerca flexuosa]|uniref:Uncharacterized protein n=2 Tax=Onchocerca flexuosa TaxID=387005 RepID=A0A183I364_9BILA|nr:hypothetical protein X798_08067 [Onchocerca flexuosa]VDP15788.1 unnamed protein product [Onchocerca flexuosa]